MAKKERRPAVGFGLPRCLNELKRLERPLYLNRQSRGRLLQSGFFRDRIGETAGKKRADWSHLLAFYGNPVFRRELFNLHLIRRTVEQQQAAARADILPPSLEYEILKPFLNPPQTGGTGGTGLDSAVEIESRVGRWSSTDDEARRETKLLLFAKATILDERAILEEAARRVPELAAEFQELLSEESQAAEGADPATTEARKPPRQGPSERPAPPEVSVTGPLKVQVETTDLATVFDAVASAYKEAPEAGPERQAFGRDLLRAYESTMEPLFDSLSRIPDVLKTISEVATVSDVATRLDVRLAGLRETVQSRLGDLENQAGENLRGLALKLLDEIGADSRANLLHPEDLERLRDLWLNSRKHPPQVADSERERLATSIPPLIQTLHEAYDEHQDLERELQRLRKDEPKDRQAHREWEDRKDELVLLEVSARRTRREACDAIIREFGPAIPSVPEPKAAEEAADTSSEAPNHPADTGDEPTHDGHEASTSSVEEPSRQRADASVGTPTAEPEPPAVEMEAGEDQALASEPSPMPEEGASPTQESETEPVWNEQEQRLRDAVADALAADPPRLSYAYHLCELAEETHIQAGLPQAGLVKAALYANRLQLPDGPLAERLTLAFEHSQSGANANGDAGWKNIDALVGFSAALPAAVIAPYSGAAAYLQDLSHEGLDVLYRFARELAQRSWDLQKAQVDATTVLQAARDQAGRRDAQRRFERDLAEWWEVGRQRKMSYIPANRVWNVMCRESNEIGRLMLTMRSEGGSDVVRRVAAQLRDESELRKVIGRHAANLLTSQQTIDAKTLLQFQRHLDEPLLLAGRYLVLEEARAPISDHRQKVVDSLAQSVQKGLPELLDQLDAEAEAQDQDPLLAAASSLAASTVQRIERVLRSTATDVGTGEPDPEDLVQSGLLRYPGAGIEVTTGGRGSPQAGLDLLLDSDPIELNVAFERYCDLGDLHLAGAVVDWQKAEQDDETVDALRSRLAEVNQTLKRSLGTEAANVRQAVDLAFSQGRISADRNSDLIAQLLMIDRTAVEGERPRFNVLREELKAVTGELAEADREERKRVLREAANRFEDKEDPQRVAIEQHVADGDLLVANELLYRTGKFEPPAPRAEGQGLLDSYLEIDEKELRSRTSNKQWPRLRRAAETGKRHGPLRFDRLDEDERLSAATLLDAWKELKRSTAAEGDPQSIREATARLLRALGFTDPRVELDVPVPGFIGARFQAKPLRRRKDCPLPQFGSMAHGRYRLLLLRGPTTADGIQQRAAQSGRQEATIAICLQALGERTRDQLVRICLREKKSLLALDEPLIGFLAAQGGSRLAAFFACALPYTYNQPFIRRASVVPPEMFFGRDREAERIVDLHGSCFVYGGRQLGKTALLRHVERTYSKPEAGQYAVWIDLKAQGIGEIDTAEIWPAIWNGLTQTGAIDADAVRRPTQGTESVRHFMQALHDTFNRETGRSLLLLFDEADRFLEQDASNRTRESFAESSRLKSLMEEHQSIKVVFAGLHNVLRTTSQSNHPLAHLGHPIRIGPFIEEGDQRHALDLLKGPLEACGCRFEPERLAQRVLAEANYYPSLIQIYGAELASRAMEEFDTKLPRLVSRGLLDSIDEDPDLREEIRQRFEWTLQLDSRYEAIAYAIAFESQSDIEVLRSGMKNSRLQRHARLWYEPGFPEFGGNVEFSALLQEMVELGVLRQGDEPGSHCLRNPNVLNLLGTSEDIESKLEDLANRKPPAKLGPRDKRRRHGDKGPLHRPLTLLQEREVVGIPRRHGAVVICGLEAAGIDNVLAFLMQGPTTVRNLSDCASLDEFKEHLSRGLRQRQRHGEDAIVFPVSGEWDRAWIQTALEIVGRLKSRPYARVVFLADPQRVMSLAGLVDELTSGDSVGGSEQRAVDIVRLGPWSAGFAAKWLDDEHDIGHKLTPAAERRLAEVSAGWPILLEHVRNYIREGGRGGQESLNKDDGVSALVAQHAESLRIAFGLDQPLLLQAVRRVKSDSNQDLVPAEARPLREDAQAGLFGGSRQIPLAESGNEAPSEEQERAILSAELLRLVQRDPAGRLRVDPIVGRLLDSIGD